MASTRHPSPEEKGAGVFREAHYLIFKLINSRPLIFSLLHREFFESAPAAFR